MELDRRGAELLFQVLTEREEKNSVATASNESFGGWTKTFTDPRLRAASATPPQADHSASLRIPAAWPRRRQLSNGSRRPRIRRNASRTGSPSSSVMRTQLGAVIAPFTSPRGWPPTTVTE